MTDSERLERMSEDITDLKVMVRGLEVTLARAVEDIDDARKDRRSLWEKVNAFGTQAALIVYALFDQRGRM